MKTYYFGTLCTTPVVGVALIAVPATAVDISKEKTLVNDSWLTGEVPDITISAQASWTTRQAPGVKSVKNDLTVKEKT